MNPKLGDEIWRVMHDVDEQTKINNIAVVGGRFVLGDESTFCVDQRNPFHGTDLHFIPRSEFVATEGEAIARAIMLVAELKAVRKEAQLLPSTTATKA